MKFLKLFGVLLAFSFSVAHAHALDDASTAPAASAPATSAAPDRAAGQLPYQVSQEHQPGWFERRQDVVPDI